jgi:hypothetical protein
MTEILTESFCERCGTRYTFESARPRVRLKGVKVLSRGLKNFVMSDETSMDEAMAAARSETDRELTSHQLDAFHKTFNFCMSCRQYTCPNCWNEVEARCLSCAPHLGHEVLPAPFPDLPAGGLLLADQGFNGSNGTNGAAHPVELIGVAEIEAVRQDEEVDAAARLAALTAATAAEEPEGGIDVALEAVAEPAEAVAEPAEAVAEPTEIVAEAGPGSEAAIAEAPELAGDEAPATPTWLATLAAAKAVDAVTPDEPAPSAHEKAASQTSGLLQRFRPGQNLDAELDAFERERVAAEAALAASTPAAEPAAAPDAAAPDAAAEPAAPATPAPVVDDVVPQPVWQMVAPDPGAATPLGQPAVPPTPPAAASAAPPNGEPQWPTRAAWTGSAPASGLPFLGRPAAPQGGLEALWAESSREVVTTPAPGRTAGVIQPCVSCGLSLSATARFCRRCGTPQGS